MIETSELLLVGPPSRSNQHPIIQTYRNRLKIADITVSALIGPLDVQIQEFVEELKSMTDSETIDPSEAAADAVAEDPHPLLLPR
jgi:hypothetical protein